jgi:twinkle protein
MNIQNEVRALCKPHFGNTNNFRITCPACNPIRKNKKDKCLSVIIKDDRILYDCKHCGESGSAPVQLVEFEPKREPIKDEDIKKMKDISSQAQHYRYLMESRNIKKEIIDKFEIITAKKYFPKLEKEADAVGFPYKNGKEVYAIKFRAIEDKAHTQEGLGAQTFFGVDFIDPKEPVVICEGELDCLSYWSAGIQAMSVPNGAPVKVSENRVDPSEDKKFQYVWKAKELLDECEKILICTDTDEAGIALAEELARRIGKAKCWQTEYPTGCKDGNDVLVAHGEQSLRDIVDRAEVWPITGLRTADFYLDDVQRLYEGGLKKGEPTGFHNIDRLMSICTGHMSIVTGIPSSGKSSFLDAMMVNLAQIRDWKFAVCSFENDPATHISQLCEKYVVKPFAEGVTERMSKDEMIKAQAWVNDHFVFIDHNNGEKATLDSILDRAVGAVQRMGVRGLVIDPYSYIDLQRGNRSETEAVGDMLTRVRLFAKHHDVHVWFVAHPAKMVREGGSIAIPQGYDISGSAHWFNHCDIGFSVARIFVDEVQCERVMVKVWKMRYRWMGMQGEEWLDFDVPTGTYSEPPAEKGWAWDIDD